VGNHIGMVSMFSSEPLAVDEYGLDVQAQVGFWPENNSPIVQVTRLDASEVISVGPDGLAAIRSYTDPHEWFGFRDTEPDFEAAASSLRLSTSNCGAIAAEAPV